MRRVQLLLCALIATGCGNPDNLSTSEPMFLEPGLRPSLRDGVWLTTNPDFPCEFDTNLPTTRWPSCAIGTLVQQGRMIQINTEGQTTEFASYSFVISPHAPHVLQLGFADNYFMYELVSPTERDPEGRIVSADRRPMDCFAPGENPYRLVENTAAPSDQEVSTAESDGRANAAASDSVRILQGLNKTERGCTTDRAYVIYSVARTYADAAPPQANFRWIRDGTR